MEEQQATPASPPKETRGQQVGQLSCPIKLPSEGRLYDGKLPNGETVIYPIRGQQEEMLAASDEGSNSIVMLQHVTQQLVKLPADFNFPDLLLTDWMALVFQILAFSYGSEVTVRGHCPTCKAIHTEIVDISALECTYASDLEEQEKYIEPFVTSPLPRSGDKVSFRMLRVHDYNRIQEYIAQRTAKMGRADNTHSYTLAQQIVAINDDHNLTDLERMRWIRDALAFDLRMLRKEMNKWETGRDMQPTVTCSRCQTVFAVPLPDDFFRQISSAS